MPKLAIIPRVIPKDFARVAPTEVERIIGKSGQIQGAKIVTSPDTKAIKKSSII